METIAVQPSGLALGVSIDPTLVRENGAIAGRDCLAEVLGFSRDGSTGVERLFDLTSAGMSQNTSNPQENAPAEDAVEASTSKPPEEWVTGDEPATGAQLSYLQTLAREVGENLPENLTKHTPRNSSTNTGPVPARRD